MAIAALVPKGMALEMLSAVLVGIAAVYFGFVLMDGRKRETMIEFGGIALTLALAHGTPDQFEMLANSTQNKSQVKVLKEGTSLEI